MASGPEGRYWVSGTEGFAAVSDGTALVRSDYPMDKGAPDYAYAPSVFPAAHLLAVGGQMFLWTRYGDSMVFRGGRWEPLPGAGTRSSEEDTPAQVNAVKLAPDGRIVLHIHSTTLLWTSVEEFRRGIFKREELPIYMTWLGFFGPTLYGLGWQGEQRAVWMRENPGKWKVLEALPAEILERSEPYGLIRPRGMPISVVFSKGLIQLREEGGTAFLSLETLLKPPAPKPLPQQNQEQSQQQQSQEQSQQRPAQIAGASAALVPGLNYIMRVFTPNGRDPIFLVSGANTGVLELHPDGPVFTRCPEAFSARGAVAVGDALRLITHYAEQIDVRAGGCKSVSPPLIVVK